MKRPEQKWQKLVEITRRDSPVANPGKPPPPGFATRILNLRVTIISLARVLLWRRWSVPVAVLCFVVFLLILAVHRCGVAGKPLINSPDLPLTQHLPR